MKTIREPAVAGKFYPAQASELTKMVAACLKQANPMATSPTYLPKAIIVPHAGFIYSGEIAANAYACLTTLSDQIKKVVLLGPAHTVAFHGLAASSTACYRTPLGEVSIDQTLQQRVLALPQVRVFDDVHFAEHSLEVQLPFLQTLLTDFTLLPLVVGNATPDKVAEVLETVWGGDETLIVISSDLSHYHDYQTAVAKDKNTSDAIIELRYQALAHDCACGRNSIKGLLYLAHNIELEGQLLDLRNSGDTAGDKQRVVGYGAYHFFPLQHYKTAYAKPLLQLARNAIEFYFQQQRIPHVKLTTVPMVLRRPMATFVTITLNNQLRGCIGSLEAVRPLAADIVHNAFQAAFHDPRFPSLTKSEWQQVTLSISILSDSTPIDFTSEAALIHALRPHIDGVILTYHQQRGTFLPSVWQSLPDPRQFLHHLKQKAGLAADFWSNNICVSRYTTEIIEE